LLFGKHCVAMFVARWAGSYVPILLFSCFWLAEFATVIGSAFLLLALVAAFLFALQFSVSLDDPCEMTLHDYTRPT
jgi:hypothetical protein